MCEFPTEVWLEILWHLRRLPPSAGGLAGPEEIRQPHLAMMMRVSKVISDSHLDLFLRADLQRLHHLVGPLLYDRVLTDDIALFLYNADGQRTIEGVPSKSDLVCSVRHLHIEYRASTSVNADRATIFYSPDRWKQTHSAAAFAEADRIAKALALLTRLLSSRGNKLESISSGAYLGGRAAHWEMCEVQAGRSAISKGQQAVLQLLLAVRCRAFCQRGVYGPLALPSQCPGLLGRGLDICVHIDQAVFRAPVATLITSNTNSGHSNLNSIGRTVWYVESAQYKNSSKSSESSKNHDALPMLIGMYANYYNHHRLVGLADGDTAHLRGYVSIAKTSAGRPDKAKGSIATIKELINLQLLTTLGYSPRGYAWDDVRRDTVVWDSMDDAPECRGCGWRPGNGNAEVLINK